MPATRLNITLPTHMVDDIKAIYGPRGVSQFLEEAVRDKLAEVKEKAYAGLIEGYRSTASEALDFLRKMEAGTTGERDV